MAKIREDLVGSVLVAGEFLFAGDAVPPGSRVSAELLAAEKTEDVPEPEKPAPKRRTRKKAVSEDAGDVD